MRARERLPALRGTAYDGQFTIPTLTEILELLLRKRKELGRPLGIYPETKHPTYFASIGLPLEETLVGALHRAGFRSAADAVFIQSFEPSSLRKLRGLTRLRLIQLIDDDVEGQALSTAAGLRRIAAYADGIGPNKQLIAPPGRPVTTLIRDAHAAGLLVHPFTFRKEAQFVLAAYSGDVVAEMEYFYRLGVDGLFSDFPDLARQARDAVARKP